MDPRIEAIWTALDELALALGQPDIVRQMLAENRRVMLAYTNLYQQLAAQASDDEEEQEHPARSPSGILSSRRA